MRKGEQRKQDLLQIAYKMFLSKGYEDTSVDEIIEAAGIAKGTYYYYFKSKEEMLEEVIGMMIDMEAEAAKQVLESDMYLPQKIVGIIVSFRPSGDEASIEEALNHPKNYMMHEKIRQRLNKTVTPLLAKVVEEGISQGIFDCDNIPERVRILLIISSALFDEGTFSEEELTVFIDTVEKLLGAKQGTMDFIRMVVNGEMSRI